jgi:hypothetical protein
MESSGSDSAVSMRPSWWRKGRLLFVLAVLVCVFGFSWVVTHEASPLHEYFLWHVAVPNAWARINLPAILLGVILSGNIHQPSDLGVLLGMTLQWGCVAFLLSLILFRVPGKPSGR